MNKQGVGFQEWPKAAKVGFIISGCLLIFTIVIGLNHLRAGQFKSPGALWVVSISESLAVIVMYQAAVLTLRQGRNWRTTLFAIGDGLVIFLLLYSISALSEQLPAETWPGLTSGDPLIELLTTITALIAALSALYGQIVAGRKVSAELEIGKQRLQLDRKKFSLEHEKKRTAKKK